MEKKPFHKFIWSVRENYREIGRMEEQIEEMRQMAYSLRSIDYSMNAKISGGKKENDGLIVSVMALEEYCKKKYANLFADRLALEMFLDKLKPIDRDVLKAYYVDRLTQEKAAEKVGYSLRQYQTLQGAAYQRAKEVYEKES